MAQTIERTRPALGLPMRRALTLGLAVSAGLLVWLVSSPLAGVDLTVGTGTTALTVGPASIVITALAAGGAGWALLALLERRSPRGRNIWRVTGWTVLTLSLLGPLSAGATGAVLASLVAMHIAVGTTLVLGLAPRATHDGAAG